MQVMVIPRVAATVCRDEARGCSAAEHPSFVDPALPLQDAVTQHLGFGWAAGPEERFHWNDSAAAARFGHLAADPAQAKRQLVGQRDGNGPQSRGTSRGLPSLSMAT